MSLSSAMAGEQRDMSLVSVNAWLKRFLSEGITGLQTRAGRGRKPIMDCSDEDAVRRAIEQDRQSEQSQSDMARIYEKRSKRSDIQVVFIRIGAKYRRINKTSKGLPSPQLYAYKHERLQELERQESQGCITLYYTDESHVCTEGYVQYGLQLLGDRYVFHPKESQGSISLE